MTGGPRKRKGKPNRVSHKRKRLERRTPLRRGKSGLSRKAGLKRESTTTRSHRVRMDRLRPVVMARDAWRCRLRFARKCTGQPDNVHHVWTTNDGGPDAEWNLITTCMSCHDDVHNGRTGEAARLGLVTSPSKARRHFDQDAQTVAAATVERLAP